MTPSEGSAGRPVVGGLADAAWPDVMGTSLVLVPVGSIEQHGPHLPLDTDTVIAVAVAKRVAGQLRDHGLEALVAPPLSYGASGEHQHFAGTCSIGTEALGTVLVELVRSLRTWAERVVFVNAHGGNLFALRAAVPRLIAEGHEVGWVACATEEVDAHAGFTETCLMLALRPDSVRVDRAVAGNTAPIGELIGAMIEGGVIAVSPNGVLGDPAGATGLQGTRVLEQMTDDIAALVRAGVPDQDGRLR